MAGQKDRPPQAYNITILVVFDIEGQLFEGGLEVRWLDKVHVTSTEPNVI